MRRRRCLLTAGLVLTLLAVLPAAADARAGSGSFSFSGGGGGGGGGGSGKGFVIYLALRLLLDLIIWGHGIGALIAIGLVLLAYFYFYGAHRVSEYVQAQRQRGSAHRRETRRRERRVELAAAEAADIDDAFGPEPVRRAAQGLFADIQSAWDRGDLVTLRRLVAPRLMSEWERRLDDLHRQGLKNHVELTRPAKVEYVGIGRGARRTAGPAGGPDRVVVRIEARLRDWVVDAYGRERSERGAPTKTVRLREYWTLERDPQATTEDGTGNDDHGLGAEFDLSSSGGRGSNPYGWILASIEQGSEGAHQLEARIVQTDWADDEALRDEALVEQAQADAADLPAGTALSELSELTDTSVAIDQDARARALDLSLADGRFSPDVLAVAVRRAVQAWAQAIDGDRTALLRVADSDAVSQMLYPAGPSSRLVLRGPRVEAIQISALDALAVPATMTVEVKVRARRYLQDRASTAILAGSDTRAGSFTERWTFALAGDADDPWRITAAASPAPTR